MAVAERLLAVNFWSAGLAVMLGAGLLTLGAQLVEAQRSQPQSSTRLAAAAAAGTGLWWPLLSLLDRSSGDSLLMALAPLASVIGWVVAVGAAMLTLQFNRVFRAESSKRGLAMTWLALSALASGGVVLLMCWGHGQLALPFLVGAGTLFVSLVLLWWPIGRGRLAQGQRGALAVAAALLPAASVLSMAPTLWQPNDPLAASPALLLAMALNGALLVHLRRHPINALQLLKEEKAKELDPLTRLSTRLGFEQQMAAAAVDADADGKRMAVMIIDLDGFNPINSSFGHEFGDKLLAEVAQRLRAQMGPNEVAGRIGGDDYVLLLSNAGDQQRISDYASALLQELSRIYLVDEREVSISCSIGIAQYPDDGGQTRMLACAEAAKNAAKRLGGACHCFYVRGMDGDARDQMDLLRDLRYAVERQELELFFQPKIDARSSQITAAEALLRWRHPTRGLLSPTLFIPVAERYGFMSDLGNWVIEDACRQARTWRDAGLRMRVAINLSAQQMRQLDIVERIEHALKRYRVHPSLLTCEITESVAMEDTEATQSTFRRLGELGVHLSIDDFGTGYSSLSYLRQLPAAELKIDRSFVTDIANSQDARSVVDAVIKLAHALSLRVVAEGVETVEQQIILTEMGCDELQGYLFSRPLSAQAIQLWAVGSAIDEPAFRASLFGDTRM
ncbi:MAG TPA: bifunctional diguanylate cyclase/phosphodiesterase [Burkholderiaceae bacterium]|jgi:diguanylate cyclase (GGDEF)-like protein